jgi:hypothetical protein
VFHKVQDALSGTAGAALLARVRRLEEALRVCVVTLEENADTFVIDVGRREVEHALSQGRAALKDEPSDVVVTGEARTFHDADTGRSIELVPVKLTKPAKPLKRRPRRDEP